MVKTHSGQSVKNVMFFAKQLQVLHYNFLYIIKNATGIELKHSKADAYMHSYST